MRASITELGFFYLDDNYFLTAVSVVCVTTEKSYGVRVVYSYHGSSSEKPLFLVSSFLQTFGSSTQTLFKPIKYPTSFEEIF